MPRFAANLTMMFNEVAFPLRFEAAAKAGFPAVEFLFPYYCAPTDVAGWVGCEYRPRGRTEDGLGWMKTLG